MPKTPNFVDKLIDNLKALVPNGRKRSRTYVRRVIPRDQHNVSRSVISESAKKVLYRLNKSGYEAYLVGGGVRDILLGGKPKDFDIATNATPEEVHALFRNSRLIGRRFRIVHVVFGREIIEVTTFRGNAGDAEDGQDDERRTNEHGLLLRDNVYGTQEEDALRRDFTVNALYYCIRDFTVIDFANGIEDLRNRRIRLIGDPETRYREDPVRMLRAVRFAAKLDFEIEPETEAPIRELAPLLSLIPPARLFDEVLKLFAAGHGEKTYDLLRRYNLLAPLFPETARAIDAGESDELIRQALRNTDARVAQGKSVTPYFLYAALLWPALQAEWHRQRPGPGREETALWQHLVEGQRFAAAQMPEFVAALKECGWNTATLQFHPKNSCSWQLYEGVPSEGDEELLGSWLPEAERSPARDHVSPAAELSA